MKSIKLKVFFLALSFFAFSATFAQDTTSKPKPDTSNKPKPDTSKLPPKHDSTSVIRTHTSGSLLSGHVNPINSALTNSKDKVEAKKEATEDEKII
jgi:hypothetical protein